MISRETYREVKKMNREQMDRWTYTFGVKLYLDGKNDATMAMCRVLHDQFGFGEKRLRELLAGQESDMEAIHQRLISAAEIQEGLAAEGCNLNHKGE